jgi:hypothetical protein
MKSLRRKYPLCEMFGAVMETDMKGRKQVKDVRE